MNKWWKETAIIGAIILSAFALPPERKIRVWLIGDSTMCLYEASRAPLTGWGMPFALFFDSTIVIDNRAKGGRSTRTFISENRWQPIADSIAAGDYVLMQFGHNDEAKEEIYKDRYTPPEDCRKNLVRFITETKVKGGIPVLITPVSRMRFDKNGKAEETHTEYSAIVRKVGRQQRVPVIDLGERSRELYDQLGPVATRFLFMQLDPGEHPAYPEGQKDNTHFNEYGARRIAELVLADMKKLHIGLYDHVIKPPVKK